MEGAIIQLFTAIPANVFKSGTTDRGKEFACYVSIKDNLGLTLYFPAPYSSCSAEAMRIPMGCFENFIQRKQTLR